MSRASRESRDEDYAAFVAARQTHLRRIAYAVCGDWHKADDLLQTALVKLYVAWPRLHRDGREEAYVRQIIVRANIDESRRPWRREKAGPRGPRPGVARPSCPTRSAPRCSTRSRRCPPMQRRTVLLRHWLGLSVEQTATELGITTGTVKSHTLARAGSTSRPRWPRRLTGRSPSPARRSSPDRSA